MSARNAAIRVALVLVAAFGATGCLGDERESEEAGQRGIPQSEPRLEAAAAPFAPRLRVEQRPGVTGRLTSLAVELTQQPSEPALTRATLIVPQGFKLVRVLGEPFGEIELAGERAGQEVLLRGRLTGAAAGSTGCVGGQASRLTAVLTTDPGRRPSLRLPVLADLHADGGSERLTLCPARGATLAPALTLRRLSVRVARARTPAGIRETVWRGVFNPQAEAGERAESQAIVPVPSFLTLEPAGRPAVRAGGPIRLRGYLLQVDPQSGRSVRIVSGTGAGAVVVGRARTGANGAYSLTVAAPTRPGQLVLRARVQSLERACDPSAGSSCVAGVVSGVSSPSLSLTILAR